MHEVLVNRLFKLAQEKVWLGELTVLPSPKLLTWYEKQKKKEKKVQFNFINAEKYKLDGETVVSVC